MKSALGIQFIAVMAEYGWTIGDNAEGYGWQAGHDGAIYAGAVKGGVDKDGSPLFVGRAIHETDLLPAKISPAHGCAFVSFDGVELQKLQYDVLCCARGVIWQAAAEGNVPNGALPVGRANDGERLFVGRVFHDGAMTPGKVHPSHGKCYIPFGGEELAFDEYEVLIVKP